MQFVNKLQQQLHQFKGRTRQLVTQGEQLVSLSTSSSAFSPLVWLASQTLLPQFYLQQKSICGEVIALGSCRQCTDTASLEQTLELLTPDQGMHMPALFGGQSFNRSAKPWPGLDNLSYFLPRLQIHLEGGQAHFILNLLLTPDNQDEEIKAAETFLQQLRPAGSSGSGMASYSSMTHVPEREQWLSQVNHALDQSMTKVVLARQTRLQLNDPISACALLQRWQQAEPKCQGFLYRFNREHVFLGCTPEQLYLRDGRRLTTESLAGTIHRGLTLQEDAQLAEQMLNDEKCQLENHFVQAEISNHLLPLTRNFQIQPYRLRRLSRVQHLHRMIYAELNPEVNDVQLLGCLPPTPAVAGTPRESALAYIQDNETFTRGWYAGVVGMLSNQSSELLVSIRSAHLCESNPEQPLLDLYAGAGLVEGSVAADEWTELDTKISSILALITPSKEIESTHA